MNKFLRFLDDRVTEFVQPLNPFLKKLVEPLDPLLAKLTILVLFFSSVGLAGVVTWNLIDRYVWPHTFVLVAGKEEGESYKISMALKEIVHQYHWNINIAVIATDGTNENLEVLEGRLNNSNNSINPNHKVQLKTKEAIEKAGAKYAHLATDQGDIIADTVAQSSTSQARTVAALYSDTFQLVVKDSLVLKNNQPKFSNLIQKKIEVPELGGQRTSFLWLAEHNGLKKEDFNFIPENTEESAVKAFCHNEIDAVFRVRALGNENIATLLNCGGKLLPIKQAAALRVSHPAFQPTVIPEGTYKGEPSSIPNTNIDTIAVKRLLLARNDMPDQFVQDITTVLNEHRPEIAEKIKEREVKPLVTYIGEPSATESTGVSLHSGASNFYRRNEPPFIKKYLDIIALIITISGFTLSLLWKLNLRLKKERKNKVDEHIKTIVELMKPEAELNKLFESQSQLERTFHDASDDLRKGDISQESFRTFNEAYKTSREFIERTIEAHQRNISAEYVEKVMDFLNRQENPDALLTELAGILIEAKKLTQDGVFSRESFRTFIGTYNVVLDTLKYNKEEARATRLGLPH